MRFSSERHTIRWFVLAAVLGGFLCTQDAASFPCWRFKTILNWNPVDMLGAGAEPHRAEGAEELPGFNEINGNLTVSFGPLVFNSLRAVTFMDESHGYTEHEQKLWRYWDSRHFGEGFNLSMFNRVLIMDRIRTDDPEQSALFMFTEDRSRVTYLPEFTGSSVWRSTQFTGTKMEVGNFPIDDTRLYTKDGSTWIFRHCDQDPLRRFQFVHKVIDRFGNEVLINRHPHKCLPSYIIETFVDGSPARTTYIKFSRDPDDPTTLTTLEEVIFHFGTSDEEHYWFNYDQKEECTLLDVLLNPSCLTDNPRLLEIRAGKPSEPQEQQMQCFFYEPLAYWGESHGFVLHWVQGPFRRGDQVQCSRQQLVEKPPVAEYVFDRNGRLREIEFPNRLGYSVHFRENQVHVAQAWHMKSDEHQDCCGGQLTQDGSGNLVCDTTQPNRANFEFCPLHELTLRAYTIEGTSLESQVSRIEDNYGRWETIERDSRGRVIRRTKYDGSVWDYGYDPIHIAGRDLPVEIIHPAGTRQRMAYDEWGNKIMLESGDGTYLTMTYYGSDPADPPWAFGTTKSVTRMGDAGWKDGIAGTPPLDQNQFLASTEGGLLVVREVESSSISKAPLTVQTLRMTTSGQVVQRTDHLSGVTSLVEWSGTQATMRWEDVTKAGVAGTMGTIQLSPAGRRIENWYDLYGRHGSIQYDSAGRVDKVFDNDEFEDFGYDDQGRITNLTTGLDCNATGCDPTKTDSQDTTTVLTYDACLGTLQSNLSHTQSNTSDSGTHYTNSMAECRREDDVERPQECALDVMDCYLQGVGGPYSYGLCYNTIWGLGCECIMRCECLSYDPISMEWYNCGQVSHNDCLDDDFWDIAC